MKTFITRDELVGEAKARHESSLLQPENGTEGSTEENALHGGKGNHPLGEGGIAGIAPLQCPVSFLLDARHSLNSVQQVVLLRRILDVCINQERVRLRVDILHGNLKAIEAACLGRSNFGGKVAGEVLVDDTI